MKNFYLLPILLLLNFSLAFSQTIDESFHSPLPVRPAQIKCLKILPDHKILVAGDITFFQDRKVNNLIRLNADYTLDESFSFNGRSSLLIYKTELQSSGDIIIVAQKYNTITEVYENSYSLIRVSENGEVLKEIDSLCFPRCLAVQQDDKILVGGFHNPVGYMYRFNPDLSLDNSFNNHIAFNNGVTAVKARDGKILIGGFFSSINGEMVNSLALLNDDGSIDPSFNVGSGTSDYVGSLSLQEDGKIFIGNTYINEFNGINPVGGMVRLNPTGSVDTSFHPPYGGVISQITVKNNTIFYVTFKELNSVYSNYLFKLRPGGELDSNFTPVQLNEQAITDFQLEFPGNHLLFNSSTINSIYGLSLSDTTGNIDASCDPQISRYGTIKRGDYLNDKLIISGDFVKMDNLLTYGIAMLNKDGSVDESFALKQNLGAGKQQKILNDTSILFTSGPYFVKLNSKGEIQPDFNFHPFKTLYQVEKFRVLDNTKILACDANNIFRLNADGTEDTDFNIGTGIGPTVSTLFDFDLQNEKIIYGSWFDKYNGTDVHKIIRLNENASLDQTFDPGSGPDDGVSTIKVLTTNDMIIGGFFTSFDGIPTPKRLTKLSQDGELDVAFNDNLNNYTLNNVFWGMAKIEQADSMLFIKASNLMGLDTIVVITIDGKIVNDFSMPLTINLLNDIMVKKDTSVSENGLKSTHSQELITFMFTMGYFYADQNDPRCMVKLRVDNVSLPTEIENNNLDPEIRVYPVPVKDKLNVSISKEQKIKCVTLYCISGQKLNSIMVNDSNFEMDMRDFLRGIYIVKIQTSEGKSYIRKIAKE